MQCTYPLVIVQERGRRWEVPCGRCASCRVSRAREWATRCLHEAAYWPASAFTTLTYRDEDLPLACNTYEARSFISAWRTGIEATLDQEEFTRFVKRVRKALSPRRIRYYACGEYGERSGRPHYHVLFFGLSPCTCSRRLTPDVRCQCPDRRVIFDAWSHGGVDRLGSVTYDSARYCADYIGKALLGKGAELYGVRSPPFQVMSQGIGRQYADDHEALLRVQRGVTVHGVQVGLPRYYANRLEIDFEEVNVQELGTVPSRVRHGWFGAYPAGLLELEAPRKQRDKDARCRVHLFRKERV